jgi:hypothetical protein
MKEVKQFAAKGPPFRGRLKVKAETVETRKN